MEQVEPVEEEAATGKVKVTGESKAIVLFREPGGYYTLVGGEPVFLLRSQDITADLVVDFWTILNGRLKELVEFAGLTPLEAVERMREVHHIVYPIEGLVNVEKHKTAIGIARMMRLHNKRKIAD